MKRARYLIVCGLFAALTLAACGDDGRRRRAYRRRCSSGGRARRSTALRPRSRPRAWSSPRSPRRRSTGPSPGSTSAATGAARHGCSPAHRRPRLRQGGGEDRRRRRRLSAPRCSNRPPRTDCGLLRRRPTRVAERAVRPADPCTGRVGGRWARSSSSRSASLGGLLAGFIGKKLFEGVWGLVDDQEPPDARASRESSWAKLVPALALQGAIFGVTRGLTDHASRAGFYRATGAWPGEEARADGLEPRFAQWPARGSPRAAARRPARGRPRSACARSPRAPT